ncbi:MAG: hypothetical protein PQ964_06990 [Methanobacteriaceae archaeon]
MSDKLKSFMETGHRRLRKAAADLKASDKFRVIHQQYIFHLLKNIKDEIYPILKSKTMSMRIK